MRTEKERHKLASLSRIFLFKVAECIYDMRCPGNLTDLEPDQAWFSLAVRKSPSLRSLLNSKSFYGWFKIDIILTNPDTVIERWHMINLPPKPELTPDYGSQANMNRQIYREMSQQLRSIYSMLNTLPVKTLQLQLDLLPTNTRRITAVCDPFKSLPAKNGSMGELETAQIRFGPISTPGGRTVVYCTHRIDLDNEIPCPIRTASHYEFPNKAEEASVEETSMEESLLLSKEMSYDPTGSMIGAMFSKAPDMYSSIISDEFTQHNEPEIEQPPVDPLSLPDFQSLIEKTMEKGFADKTSLDDIRKRFYGIQAETDDI